MSRKNEIIATFIIAFILFALAVIGERLWLYITATIILMVGFAEWALYDFENSKKKAKKNGNKN